MKMDDAVYKGVEKILELDNKVMEREENLQVKGLEDYRTFTKLTDNNPDGSALDVPTHQLKEAMKYMFGVDKELDEHLVAADPELYKEAQEELAELKASSNAHLGKHATKKAKADRAASRKKLEAIAEKHGMVSRIRSFPLMPLERQRVTYKPDRKPPKTKVKSGSCWFNGMCIGTRAQRRAPHDPKEWFTQCADELAETLKVPKRELKELEDLADRLKQEIEQGISLKDQTKLTENEIAERKKALAATERRVESKKGYIASILDTTIHSTAVEDLTIATKQGDLKGYCYKPDRNSNPDIPQVKPADQKVVIFFSGTHSSNAAQAPGVVNEYNKRGATVIGVDYRGFGKSISRKGKGGTQTTTALSEDSIYRDGRAVYEYVRDTMGIPPNNIILHGFSLGGAVASKLAADLAEENAKKMAEGGVVNEEERLGGVVLHSAIDNMKIQGDNSSIIPFSGSIAKSSLGAYNTAEHLERLARYDTHIPLHLRGGAGPGPTKKTKDAGDSLSLLRTGLEKVGNFKNRSSHNGGAGHQKFEGEDQTRIDKDHAVNFSAGLEAIDKMLKNGRQAKLT